jgi:transcriptional regulator with XRE-family HTH domain
MSIAQWESFSSGSFEGDGNGDSHQNGNGHQNDHGHKRALHRLATVRRQQGISQRNIARRMNLDIATVREQEEEGTDLTLSMLYRWQRILDVPVAELLVDSDGPLSPPVMQRAQMVKVMKTVAAMVEKAETTSLKRLLQMLCSQLLEIMPELSDVAPWHSVGQRRTLDEYGRAVERQMSDDVFRNRSR